MTDRLSNAGGGVGGVRGEADQSLQAEFHPSISNIDSTCWDRLTSGGGPLLSHRFLSILEQTGAISPQTGWQPSHVLLKQGERAVAVMPLYLKTHSWGEYVFDWSWAEAWHRLGIPYYPKLVTAVPLTPAAGPRLCIAPGVDRTEATQAVLQAVRLFAEEQRASGWHLLFPSADEADSWQQQGLIRRTACNFQWFNRQYADYEAFLADMTSRARKALRRERRKMQEQGLNIRQLTGDKATLGDWQQMYLFYRDTCMQRGQSGYLNEDFFSAIGEQMPGQTLLTLAADGERAVAGAFCFYDEDCLYGRYWGCVADYDSLHFELCYHRGIDFCLANNIRRYDPGAQGEHKIRRGFVPVFSHSMHWLAEERLRPAVAQFCRKEHEGLRQYRQICRTRLPFRLAKCELLEPPEPL